MVVLNKIYTKTGDKGTTALGNGERRPKYDLRIEAYGVVDEVNATLGVVRCSLRAQSDLDKLIQLIQNDLFDLGADLCVPAEAKEKPESRLRISDSQVDALEQAIDKYNANLAPLRSFILPGGSEAASHLHVARTQARRAERLVAALGDMMGETVTPAVLIYLNRLSDLFFVLARFANNEGADDVLWVPGANRKTED